MGVARFGYPSMKASTFYAFEPFTVYEGVERDFMDWWNYHRPRGADSVEWAAEGDRVMLKLFVADFSDQYEWEREILCTL
tara:strand:- start:199 stop:438 length:240 start_codon:yes stop_codon:yes gene_type:complete